MRVSKQQRWDHDNMEVSLASVGMNATAAAVAFANGPIRKSLFQMLQMVKRVAREWSFARTRGRARKRMGKKRKGERKGRVGNKFTVGHARGVKSATKNLCLRICARARLSERPRYSPRGMGNTRENERSRGRQIARGGGFTIFRCRFLWSIAFPFNGTRRDRARLLFTRAHPLAGSLNDV